MPSDPKVSVIIPVYNVSAYLRKCLDSVVNQTLKEIEIIIVNDCSPDPLDDEICAEYETKDPRIVYIKHEKNLGLGGARNTGIRASKGDYIGFVDSDDFISAEMYEAMFKKVEGDNADVVICGAYSVTEECSEVSIFSKNPTELELINKDAFEGWLRLNGHKIWDMAWDKLWKKSLFIDNNIFFPENMLFEDFATTPRLMFFSKKVLLVKEAFYHYRRRNDSISKTTSMKHIIDLGKAINIIEVFINGQKKNGKYKNDFNNIKKIAVLHCCNKYIVPCFRSQPQVLNKYFEVFGEEFFRIYLDTEKQLELSQSMLSGLALDNSSGLKSYLRKIRNFLLKA